MISNYLKLAWRILSRRKFFTFISLFGISFTLGILMTTLSFLQSELGTNAPLSKKNDFIYMDFIALEKSFYDTLTIVDTVMKDGIAVYDTTYKYDEVGTATNQSEFNHNIIQEYLTDLSAAEEMTMFSSSNEYNVFVNGVKLSIDILLSDANYLKIFDHPILEGRVFDEQEVENGEQVIVIANKLAAEYFGRDKEVVGEEMFIDGKTYKVIGVFEHKGKIVPFVSPDAVSPYTTRDFSTVDNFYFDSFETMYVKKKGVDASILKEEIKARAANIPLDHPDNKYDYTEVVLKPKTYNEMYAQAIYYESEPEKSYGIMKWVLIGLMTFFTVLPTLNLINLNVSRILDRSSEIGVRKAFGAHDGNIIMQFIIENIVQTILGGLIGFLIAFGLIKIINSGGYLGSSVLTFNAKFFVYSIIVTLVFGILSGFLPAYKMSRLQIVKALKENKL